MTQTETALMIVVCVLLLFGGPFFLGFIEALTTNNQAMMPSLTLVGFIITGFCLLVLITGVWLDGFN